MQGARVGWPVEELRSHMPRVEVKKKKKVYIKGDFFKLPIPTNTLAESWPVEVLVAQSCPSLCNPMDYSPPGSSVQGILQASTLEWVAMPSSRGSSQPRDWTQVSHITGRFFNV